MTEDKVSQASVKYRFGGNVCHACVNFIENSDTSRTDMGTCKKVFGAIGQNMLCDLFQRMKNMSGTNASVKGD